MGQTLSSETLSISGGDGYRYWVGLIMKPSEVGCKKTVYKGVLLGHGPRQWEKVVAKAFTDIPGTKESWKHELSKADVTKQLAAQFVREYRCLCAIRIVIPGIVQMDRVSNINRRLADKDDGRGLTKDEWISVEELIPGRMGRFCPWSNKHTRDLVESEHMQAFSHFTYKVTDGELVACDFQGTYNPTSNQYIFTDSSIHSTFKLYGLFDQGEHGITEFFKLHVCNDICNGWRKPTPLTPPPSFESACLLQRNLTPASAFENIIFPAYSGEIACGYVQSATNRDGDRRRHNSEQQQLTPRRAAALRLAQSIDTDGHLRPLNARPLNARLLNARQLYARPLQVNSEREPTIREHIRDQDNAPPAYENVTNSSLPPCYDSLVHHGGSSHCYNLDINFRNPVLSTLRSGSSEQLRDGREACNCLTSRHRSATDPLLHWEAAADTQSSDACAAASIQPALWAGESCSKCKSSPAFCSVDPSQSLLVPSAPPDEGDDISGT